MHFIGLFTGGNITKFVLEIFNDNLFTFNHTFSFISSLFTVFSISRSFDDSKNIFVSSANRKNLSFFDIFGKSLIYKRNKSGPRTEPCGTLHVIYLVSEKILL